MTVGEASLNRNVTEIVRNESNYTRQADRDKNKGDLGIQEFTEQRQRRHRDTQRQTDRQIGRQRQRQKETDRQTDRQTDRDTK